MSTRDQAEELPSVGPPSDRLFKQGKCRACGVPLFGREPVRRDICGMCGAAENEQPLEGKAA